MKNKRDVKHRGRSIAALIAVAASIGSHLVVMSATAGRYIEAQQRRLRRPSVLSPLQLQNRRIESSDAECKGSSLMPSDILKKNEFICNGELRFGIDYRGRFILGFAANYKDTTPEKIAWRAKPTTLFVEPERPFDFIRLTEDGNILGFDSLYAEIYDSNYDYQNRQQGKEEGSILVPSDDCLDAESVQSDTFCVSLMTSQAKPGMPNGGVITWGVKVYSNAMLDFEPPSSSPTPVPSLQPSQFMPTYSPSAEFASGSWDSTSYSFNSTSYGPTLRLTSSPSSSPSIATSNSTIQIGLQATKTIVYGYVWMDENRNGKMDTGEKRFSDFEVKFYKCLDNGQVSATGSVRTDVEGLYFIQLSYGDYRALFEADPDKYGYSAGVQDSNSGWTDCLSSPNSIITSNVGLYSKDNATFSTEAIAYEATLADEEALMTEEEPVQLSSITGFIYIDRNNNKTMDSDERSIAVKGYTTRDAIMKVSLLDCQPNNSALPSVKYVEFPGTYMFSNLNEGSYKLKFELIAVDPNANITSMYSFIDGTDKHSSSRETKCGKLGQGQDNDQGDVGLQAAPELLAGLDVLSARADSEGTNINGSTESGGGGTNVPGVIGGVVAACLLAVGLAIFVLQKRQLGMILSFRQNKERNENSGILGSPVDGDMSTTSDGGSTHVDRCAAGVQQELNGSEDSGSCDDEPDDDDSRNDIFDYGPVVSNIIAQYSQQQHQKNKGIEVYLDDNEQQLEQSGNEGYNYQYQNQLRYPSVYRNTSDHKTSQTGLTVDAHYDDNNNSGYYSDSHNHHYQQQHYKTQYCHHDRYDEASTYSSNSADPPAASYTNLSAHNEDCVGTYRNERVEREGYEVQYAKPSPIQSDSDSDNSGAEENSQNVISVTVSAVPGSLPGSRSSSNPRDNRGTSNKSVVSSGSDQSSDPPGASYKDTPLDRRLPVSPPRHKGRGSSLPPPPPRKFPSPQQQRYVSPHQLRYVSQQQQRYPSR